MMIDINNCIHDACNEYSRLAAIDMGDEMATHILQSLLAAASFAVVAACGHDAPQLAATRPYDNPAWPTAAIADPARLGFTMEGLRALDARMKQAVDNKEIAGISYALVKDGEVATFKAVGNQILGGAPMRTTPSSASAPPERRSPPSQ